VNREFYGKNVMASDILSGKMQAPAAAEPLMTVLDSVAPTGVARR
jgi:lipid-binding SYLF domain-containing protein